MGGLLALLLVASACGGSRDDDASNIGTSETTEASGPSGGAGGTDFGDLPSPCGEAPDGAPGAVPAGQLGVTDDTILIGYGDDAGYQGSPGLNHQMSDAVKAMIDWCNDQGGINGRTIEGNYYDAKILDVGNAMTAACEQVFMLVGTGWALDGGGEPTRVGCGLPMVASYITSPTVSMGPGAFAPLPQPVDRMNAATPAALAEAFPDEVVKAASVFADFPATIESKDRFEGAAEQFGWEFLECSQSYAISGESGWAALVQRLKGCGAEAVYFTGAADPNLKNLLDAAAQADYEPIWVVLGNLYEESFSAWNQNGNADNVYLATSVIPFEQTDNPATAQYVELVEGSGGDISVLGAQAASAFLLWATAVQGCGDDVTRECVVAELEDTTAWTGGGLHAETNPGGNLPAECGMTLRLQGTEFVQWSPEELSTFDCDPAFVATVDIPAAAEAEVGPDRKSRKYTG
jgi:ABC-type branched-subunit amino acid transport system substrate-binding protein